MNCVDNTKKKDCSSNKKVPYYLIKNKDFKLNDITAEIISWSNCCDNSNNFNEDPVFTKMENTLKNIKNKIYTVNSTDNSIQLCSKGLDLSIKLCEYCIEKGYDSLNFIQYNTKYFYDYFNNQLEHFKTYNKYEKAKNLEKNGYLILALDEYVNIIEDYLPKGSIYYSEPFYLSINILQNATAIKIFNLLKSNILNYKNTETSCNFDYLLNEFEQAILKLKNNKNMYNEIENILINNIKLNPGIFQTEIYKKFDMDYKTNISFILRCMEKSNTIRREKSGRSYKLYLL